MITIAVEGNIGSGKTTLLNYFKSTLKSYVTIFEEPVNQWKNFNGHNLLQQFYVDPKRWSFPFQRYADLTRYEIHRKQLNVPFKFIERSLFSSRFCFIENLYKNGSLSDLDYFILDDFHKYLHQNIKVDLIVYLKTRPETCFKRVELRGRNEESTIKMDYLKQLHEHYENWLNNTNTDFLLPSPIFTIDADACKDDVIASYEKFSHEFLRNKSIDLVTK